MKSCLFLLAFLTLFWQSGHSQVASYYKFSQTSGTYTPITGTSITSGTFDDVASSVITIPTFKYNGTNVTRMFVSPNGWVAFRGATGSVTSTTATPLSSGTTATGFLAPMGVDLNNSATGTPEVSWAVVGTEVVVQWKDVGRYVLGGSTERLNFQLHMDTVSGIIRFIYDAPTGFVYTTDNPQIGLRGTDNTFGTNVNNRELTTLAAWTTTTAGTSNTSTVALIDSNSNIAVPASGLIFVFSPPTCFPATAVTASNINPTTADLSWTAPTSGTPAGYAWEVVAHNAGAFSTPIAGNYVIGGGTTSASVSGLSPSTTYDVYVKTGCSLVNLTDTSVWSAVYSFTTPCNPITSIPWTEGFEGVSPVGASLFPSCWSSLNLAGTNNPGTDDGTIVTTHGGARTGTKFIYSKYNNTAWVFTPGFQLTAGTSYDFGFFMKNQDISSPVDFTMDVAYGSAASVAGMTHPLITGNGCTNTAYQPFSSTFTPATTGTYYFGIKSTSTTFDPWYLSFDDFSLQLTPACSAPTAITSSAVTATSATISFTAPATGTPLSYSYVVVPSGAGPFGPALVSGSLTAPTVTFATGSVLTANTTYDVYVQTHCSANPSDTSAWSPSFSFTTACGVVTSLPYTESFDGASLAADCWSADAGSGYSYLWEVVGADASHGAGAPQAGAKFARLNVYNADEPYNPYTATSPSIVLPAAVQQVSYYYFLGEDGYTGVGGDPSPLVLQVSTDGGTTWTDIYTHTSANSTLATGSGASNWHLNTVVLGAYINTTALFRFSATSNYGGGTCNMGIDEFSITAAPSCLPPTAVTASAVTATSATLSWTAPVGSTPAGYAYEVVASGAGPYATPVVSNIVAAPATTAATGSVLTPNTTYDVYVKSGCSPTNLADTSVWSAVYSFTTPCVTVTALPYTEAFDGASLGIDCWSAAAGATGYDYLWETVTADGTHGATAPQAGASFARLNVYNADEPFNPYTMTSPPIALPAAVQQVSYYYFLGEDGFTGTDPAGTDPYPLVLQISTDNGTTWSDLYSHSTANSTFASSNATSNWHLNTVVLGSYTNSTSLFRFAGTSNYGSGVCNMGVDQFTITAAPSCLPPTGVTASAITPTSATLSWTAPAGSTPAGYAYEVVASGAGPFATPVASNIVAAPTTTAPTGSVLTPATTYDVYVKTGCSPTNLADTSVWSAVYSFTTPALCSAPTAVIASAVTTTGATISWRAPASIPALGYVYKVVASGAGVTGTAIATGAVASSDTFVVLSSLSSATVYDVYVRSACNATDSSSWAGPRSVTTLCGTYPLPLVQGFNSTTRPICWTEQAINGTVPLRYVASSTDPVTTPQEGSDYVFFNSFNSPYTAGTEVRLVSPQIVSTGTPSVDVSFYWYNDNSVLYGAGAYRNEGATLQYSLNGTTWTDVQFFARQDSTLAAGTGAWKQKIATLPAAAGNQAIVYVGFKFHSEYGENLSFDNLHIYSTPACSGIPAALVASAITPTSAVAKWTAATPVPASGYHWVVVTAGGSPTGTTVASGSTADSAIVTGLTPNTAYDFYVQTDCGGSSFGAYTGPLNITTPPTCIAPSGVTSVSFTATGGSISWTASPSAPALGYIYTVVASGAGANSTPVASGAVASGVTTATFSGLTANTPYDVYVKAACSSTDSSAWAGPLSVTTPCGTIGLPLVQGFNTTTRPACWTEQTINGNVPLQYVASSSNPATTPQEGADYVFFNSYNTPYTAGTEVRLVSPPIVSTGTPSIDVSFYWFNDNSLLYGAGAYLNEGVTAQYSLNGTTWTDLQFFPRQDSTLAVGTGLWKQKVLTLPAAAGNQATVYVGFKFHSEYGENLSFDNLHIYSTPTCAGAPSALAASNILPTSATATWTAATPVPANGYSWVVVATGGNPTGTAVASGTSTTDTALITGLTPNTVYDFYVQSDCGGGSLGAFAGPLSITTPPTCVAPTALTVSSMNASGVTISWTASPSANSNGYVYVVVDSGAAATATPVATGSVAAGATTATVTGLASNTYYTAYVRAACSSTDSSAWSGSVTFLTPCTNRNIPLIEGFNNTSRPSCWTEQFVNGTSPLIYTNTFVNPNMTPQEGSNFVVWDSYNSPNTAGTETRLVSPPLTTTGTPSVDVSFYWFNENSNDYNTGHYLNEGVIAQYSLDGVTWTDVQFYARQDFSLAPSVGRWNQKIFTLPAAAGNQPTVYVGFKFHSEYGDNCGFDNLHIYASSPCAGAPTNIVASPTSTTSASITWTAAPSAPANGYNYVVVASGDSATGTVIASGAVNAGVTTATVSGLTPNTPYSVYVQSNCGGATGLGYWSGPANFSTPCSAITTLPWTEGFEGLGSNVGTNFLPPCWLGTPYGRWSTIDQPLIFPPLTARGGTNYLFNSYNAQDTVYTPSFTLTGGQQYEFYFYYQTDGDQGWDTIQAMIGNAQSPTGMTAVIGTPVLGATNSNYVKYSAIFTPATSGDYFFGVELVAQSNPNNIAFDDFGLQPVIPCPNPPLAGTISGPSSVCFGTQVSLSLTGYSPYTTLQWQSSTDSINFTDIQDTFDYYQDVITAVTYYRVKVKCADSTYSPVLAIRLNAPTLCYCVAGLGGGCGPDNIDTALIQGTNFFVNYTACNYTNGGDAYASFPAVGDSTTTLQRGGSYDIYLHMVSTAITSVWIDFDQNGVFDTYEWVQPTFNAVSGTATITVPAGAVLGQTGMRIRSRDAGNPNDSTSACDNFGTGEAFDFIITIADTNCSHPPIVTNTATDVSCFGGTNGAIALTLTGGVSPITHQWSSGQTTASLTGVPAGSYTDTIDFANGCIYVYGPVVVAQPTALIGTTDSITSVKCFGGNNGAVYVSVSGGTAPYTHHWSTGAAGVPLTGLTAGIYSDTITDGHGCTVIAGPDTVKQPASALAIALDSVHNVKCNGQSNGAAYITVSGGTGPYSYLWNNTAQSTTDDITGLPVGVYTVVVTDRNLCTATAVDTIKQPNVLAVTTDSIINVKCNGASTGSVYVSVTGGTLPYTYLWTGGANTQSLFFKPAGAYTLVATDKNGCTATVTDTIKSPFALVVTSVATDTVQGGAAGSITLTTTGGTQPYKYHWNTNDSVSSLAHLAPGIYVVTVTDANGCTSVHRDTIDLILGITDAVGDITNFNVYPNPSSGVFNVMVEVSHAVDVQLEVYTVTGQQVAVTPKNTANHTYQIDLGTEAAGVYIVKVKAGDNTITRRLTVVK